MSFYATRRFTSNTLLFNAGLFLLVGLMLITYLMKTHEITFRQAIFGTWQWKRALHKLSSHTNSSTDNNTERERLLQTFAKVDANGDGQITPDELLDGLHEAGVAPSVKEIRVMIQFADKDGDGMISKEEWKHGYLL